MTPRRWKKRATRSRRATPSCSASDPLAAMMTLELPKTSVAETLAEKIVALKAASLPATTTRKCEDLLIDIVGLCVTARNEDYVASALAGWDDDGPCTVIGHQRTLNAAGAAFVNGTAAHGEDFDDTFEGGAVRHSGGVAGTGRVCRPAHRARGRAWPVSWFRTHGARRLPCLDRRFRHALGDGYAGVQALSLRDDGAALYRLCETAGCARRQG